MIIDESASHSIGTSYVLPSRQAYEPAMMLIPAGEFLMGSDPETDQHAKESELPQHSLYLPNYAMARTPVTNAQYAAFVQAARHTPPGHWRLFLLKRKKPPNRLNDHPVVNVTWYDARAYCRWLSEVTGASYRLPSEAEWEKAARSADGRIYPWGDEWDAQRCNIGKEHQKDGTTPVDAYPKGVSPHGLLDTIGNVWEWTRSLWGMSLLKPEFVYPYDPDDGRENTGADDTVRRILRGVSFFNDPRDARCASRYRYSPRNFFESVGFRVVISPFPGEL